MAQRWTLLGEVQAGLRLKNWTPEQLDQMGVALDEVPDGRWSALVSPEEPAVWGLVPGGQPSAVLWPADSAGELVPAPGAKLLTPRPGRFSSRVNPYWAAEFLRLFLNEGESDQAELDGDRLLGRPVAPVREAEVRLWATITAVVQASRATAARRALQRTDAALAARVIAYHDARLRRSVPAPSESAGRPFGWDRTAFLLSRYLFHRSYGRLQRCPESSCPAGKRWFVDYSRPRVGRYCQSCQVSRRREQERVRLRGWTRERRRAAGHPSQVGPRS
jgi:hypothetical protein